MVAVSDKIICNQRDVLETSDIELLMLDIHYSKNTSFVFGVLLLLNKYNRCTKVLEEKVSTGDFTVERSEACPSRLH